ncbi:hypothetical protein F511_14806 [Dorcoceras hygrometricum]|uniref:Uncharacterized protein n=1 Tax=Dorcoceras hygrometricum TaxID=472368 RepID=A0A2Z7CEY9_9LAMI|nr:hypothetical protein F511_14806 [Dorcoceras hygrometricum]
MALGNHCAQRSTPRAHVARGSHWDTRRKSRDMRHDARHGSRRALAGRHGIPLRACFDSPRQPCATCAAPTAAHGLGIPLIPMWDRFIHVSLRLEACQEPFIVRATSWH